MSAQTASGPARVRAGGAPATVRASAARRARTTSAVLLLLVLALAWVSLTWGGRTADLLDQLGALVGVGEGGGSFVLMTLRLPRVALCIVVGVAFGLSGALFQSVLRNPLASPDVLGISGGASLAAAGAILVLGLSGAAVSAFAAAGALVAAGAIYLLAWRDGVSGHRFVLVGVGVAFVVSSGIGYLLTRSDVNDVHGALVWMVGSIGTPPWPDVAVAALVVLALLPCVALASGRLRALQLGDDLAGGLGVRVERARLAVLVVGVLLAAAGTAAAGPVAFVAFVSAPIARRLPPASGLALVPSALVGALVLLAAELVAQQLLGQWQVPVGIVTGLVGAPYLLWLLATSTRGGRNV